MKAILAAATKLEIAPAIQYLNKRADWNVLITGIGGVATAFSLTKAIEKYKPDLLLQAGIAGGFDKKINLGEVVAVRSDFFGDLGVVEDRRRRTLFDLSLMVENEKPFKNGRLINPNKRLLKSTGLSLADAVSVNEITTRKADIDYYKNDIQAFVESMEGGAFHYVALMEKIPFLQIRSISNYVGERNRSNWKMKEAITNLNIDVIKIIDKISKGK